MDLIPLPLSREREVERGDKFSGKIRQVAYEYKLGTYTFQLKRCILNLIFTVAIEGAFFYITTVVSSTLVTFTLFTVCTSLSSLYSS